VNLVVETAVTENTQTTPAVPTIAADSFVTLHYRISLTGVDSDFLNTFEGKPATLQLGASQLAPQLEEKLIGLAQGQHAVFELPAGSAYGERSVDLLQRVSHKLLQEQSEAGTEFVPGDVVEFAAPGGGRYAGVLKEIDAQGALFDFNHPLAGQALRFEVKVLGVL
jgi:FKBP-type peptidyl-prolyl cis-trans isomerase SlpA